MSIKTREVKYTECDGCGYIIDTKQRYTTLDLAWNDGGIVGQIPLHFHSEGEHDCLRYWITSPLMIERTLKENHSLVPPACRDKILSTLAYRRDKVA